MEEYTLQILDMLVNIQEPLASPVGEREDTGVETHTCGIEGGDQERPMAKGSPKRIYSRMMSVPSYVHRQQVGSSSSLRFTPMYFRHKLSNSNLYPPWYRQVLISNWHHSSVEKAIRKFKRSSTLPSLKEPFTTRDNRSMDDNGLLSQAPSKQLPLRRSDSEGTAQSQGLFRAHKYCRKFRLLNKPRFNQLNAFTHKTSFKARMVKMPEESWYDTLFHLLSFFFFSCFLSCFLYPTFPQMFSFYFF